MYTVIGYSVRIPYDEFHNIFPQIDSYDETNETYVVGDHTLNFEVIYNIETDNNLKIYYKEDNFIIFSNKCFVYRTTNYKYDYYLNVSNNSLLEQKEILENFLKERFNLDLELGIYRYNEF